MRLARAVLARHGVPGEPDLIRSEVPIGATYVVDLDSIRPREWINSLTGVKTHPLSLIAKDDATGSFGWFQVRLLDIDEGPLEKAS